MPDAPPAVDDQVVDEAPKSKRPGDPGFWTAERRAAASERAKAKWAEKGGQGFGRADAAPKQPLGPKKAAGRALAKKLQGIIEFAAGMAKIKEPFDGAVLEAGAPKLAETYAAVLERHPRAVAFLNQLETGGVYGAAAIATLTVALPILAHHRVLPEAAFPLAVILSPVPMGVPMTMNGAGHPAGE